MIQIVGLGFVVTMLAMVIRQQRPELALLLGLALSAMLFLFVMDKIAAVLELFNELAQRAHVDTLYLHTLLRIIGIAYITEFGAQVCKDAGEGAVAGKVEFAGKVMVMVAAIPIIALVMDTMLKMIP